MSRVIQMIVTSPENSIFICSFDIEKSELKFRASYEPEYLQTEVVKEIKGLIYTQLYHFHPMYLKKFIKENSGNEQI